MKVGVDIDDVLRPWYEHAHAVSVQAGIANGVTPRTWHPYKEYGAKHEAWLAALSEPTRLGLAHPLYGAAPYEGTVEALTRILAAGHSIHLVTARGTGGWPHGDALRVTTVEWLAKYAVPHDTLTFSRDKSIVHTDMFIDDNVDNYDGLIEAGINAYLLNRPWNSRPEDWKGSGGYRLRVSTIGEFADRVILGE